MTDTTTNQGPQFKARLVRMTSSLWSAKRRDQQVTREVNEAHGTANAGRFIKSLLVGDTKEYDDLKTALNTARADHYFHTLKWDTGVQLLPTKNSPAYNEARRRNVVAFEDTRRAFLAAYDRLVDNARRPAIDGGLGDLFNEKDYPHSDRIADRISLEFENLAVPAAGDFRVEGLGQEEVENIRAEIDARVRLATGAAMENAKARLGAVVGKMADTLARQKGDKGFGFKDTLVENIRAEVEVLKSLNLTDDDGLESFRKVVEDELTKEEADTLRNDPSKRSAMARKAAEIQKKMGGAYGGGAK
jgi:hypothetical protein